MFRESLRIRTGTFVDLLATEPLQVVDADFDWLHALAVVSADNGLTYCHIWNSMALRGFVARLKDVGNPHSTAALEHLAGQTMSSSSFKAGCSLIRKQRRALLRVHPHLNAASQQASRRRSSHQAEMGKAASRNGQTKPTMKEQDHRHRRSPVGWPDLSHGRNADQQPFRGGAG
nr:hypothetical protein CFP56_56983 [Quercus suber]